MQRQCPDETSNKQSRYGNESKPECVPRPLDKVNFHSLVLKATLDRTDIDHFETKYKSPLILETQLSLSTASKDAASAK